MQILQLSQHPEYKDTPYNYLKEHWWEQVDLDWLFENIQSETSIPDFLIAVENEKVIWMALIDFYYYEKRDRPWLWSLYVLKEYRWNGIWEKLVKELEGQVKKLWFSRIWLDSYDAWAYYEKPEHNYTYYKDKYRVDDKYVKVYFKDLWLFNYSIPA